MERGLCMGEREGLGGDGEHAPGPRLEHSLCALALFVWREWKRAESEDKRQDLLSNDVVVVGRVDLEGAVVGPQVDLGCHAGQATLIHLAALAHCHPISWR